MLKWILGCFGVVLVLGILAVCFGMNQMKKMADQGPAVVAMAASPERVFASLSDADSLKTWRAEGNKLTAVRRGPLQVGDTISSTTESAGRTMRMHWIVTSIVPNSLVAWEMRADSGGTLMGSRRDSVYTRGDSTYVTSVFNATMLDSLRQARGDTGSGGMMGMATDMMAGAMRMQAIAELEKLRLRVEGSQGTYFSQPSGATTGVRPDSGAARR